MRLDGRWTLEDRLAEQVRSVPFEVPPGTARITVVLEYDRSAGGVLDLGCASPNGFRGWSGGARSGFAVGVERSTPGYLPGPIDAGVWEVWIGLYRIPPEGVRYELTIGTTKARPGPHALPDHPPTTRRRPPRRPLPAVDGLRWYAGDLHAHTVHSDGALTVDELAVDAAEAGLDFLAVTDHNTTSHHPELADASRRYGVQLIAGQEVTTDLGHANVWGTGEWIDFRQPADVWADGVAPGLLSVNHPMAADCAWRHPMTAAPGIAEVWHWSWSDRTWGYPLAWIRQLPAGVIPVGGSDFHRPGGDPARLGEPVTWVLAEDPSTESVLDGIRHGRTAISAGLGTPLVLRSGDEIAVHDAEGLILVRPDNTRTLIHGDRRSFPGGQAGMYRLETWRNEVVALCG